MLGGQYWTCPWEEEPGQNCSWLYLVVKKNPLSWKKLLCLGDNFVCLFILFCFSISGIFTLRVYLKSLKG